MKFKSPLFVLLAFVACVSAPIPADTDASVVDAPISPSDEEIMANYLTDVHDYWENGEWRSWMIQRKNWWSSAYISGRRDHEIHVYVRYENPVLYNPPWSSEAEHFNALSWLANLQFPGWDFAFSTYYEGVEVDMKGYDVVAVLGHKGVSNASGRTVYLVYETIFAHEFGHILGLHHHYCGDSSSNEHCPEAYPPDEGPCIMDRNSVSFGPTENNFLLLTTRERQDEDISMAMNNILDRYPGQGFASINWNECGTGQ